MRHYAYLRNLRYYLNLATPEQVKEGLAWYGESARAEIERIALECQLDYSAVAGVVALLSPRVRWYQNVADAERFCRAYRSERACPIAAGLPANRRKAWQWLHTRNYSLITGNKVSAFYANLTGDETRVTVDTWATRAATKCKLDAIDTPKRYYVLQTAYQRLAAETGYTPAQVQAIVWVTIRSL